MGQCPIWQILWIHKGDEEPHDNSKRRAFSGKAKQVALASIGLDAPTRHRNRLNLYQQQSSGIFGVSFADAANDSIDCIAQKGFSTI
jgi:hypothetical protein